MKPGTIATSGTEVLCSQHAISPALEITVRHTKADGHISAYFYKPVLCYGFLYGIRVILVASWVCIVAILLKKGLLSERPEPPGMGQGLHPGPCTC